MSSLVVILILVHLGLLLAVAGAVKAADPGGFAAQLSAHNVVPASLRRMVAFSLPILEVFVGLWLVSGIAFRDALLAAIAVLGVFLAYRALMFRAQVRAPCGCFGSVGAVRSSALAETVALTINVGLAVAALLLAGSQRAAYPTYLAPLVCTSAAAGLLSIFVAARRRVVAQSRELEWALTEMRRAGMIEGISS